MPRIKAVISYDGSKFHGFQRLNENGKKTKDTVISALEELLPHLGIESKIEGAGRTDRGVHATGQVISFDVPEFWELPKLKEAMNRKLWPGIRVRRIAPVGDAFHPRFDANRRAYRYLIATASPSVFGADYCLFIPEFNMEKARTLLKQFEGTHDFAAFRKTGSDEKTTVRTVYKTAVYEKNGFYVLFIEGDAFLRSQVRLMVASLLAVLDGKMSEKELTEQLLQQTMHCRVPVPASGLYLARITYALP